MAKSVTIVDIAQALNLSKSVVSSALTGQGRVSDATRQRIVDAASRMGYVTNRSARLLRGQSTGALGLYIPAQVRILPFYMHFAFGVVDEAATMGQDVTLFGRASEAPNMGGPQIDGAIIADPLTSDPVIERIARTGVPIVTAGRIRGPRSEIIRGVIEVDNFRMGTKVLDYLSTLGARRPALIAPDSVFDSPWAADVQDTYLEWCSQRRIDPNLVKLSVAPTAQTLESTVRHLTTNSGADALVCAVQGLAGRCQSILESLGYELGKDFHLASLAGDPATELPNEKITALDLEPFEFGREAAKMMGTILRSGDATSIHEFHQVHLHLAGPGARDIGAPGEGG